MLPVLQIGPLAIQTFGLVLLLSLWSGIWLAEKFANKFHIPAELLDKLIVNSLVSSVLAARLFYFLRYPSAFLKSPLNLISLNLQMMDWSGGALAGALIFLILVQRKKLEIWSVLDALSPLLPVIGMGLGLATFAVGSQYGTPTGLPWGINLWGEIRHPVQLYQTFGFLLIMIFQLRHLKGLDSDGDNSPKEYPQQGGTEFLWILIWSAVLQILLDTFRQDTLLLFGRIHGLQIISFIIVLLAILQLNKVFSQKEENRISQEENEVINGS